MNKEIEKLLKDILEADNLDCERLRKLRNCKNMILLDMGCGSTSAAVLELKKYIGSREIVPTKYIQPVTWNYPQMSADFKRWLSASDTVSIPTLIGYNDDLKPIVGTDALNADASCENFKACPTEQNLDKVVLQVPSWDGVSFTPKRLRDVWSDYFKCVLEKVCNWCSSHSHSMDGVPRNLTELANGETIVMVAHPAGAEWSEPSVLKSYRDLISKGAGVPDENILTISEAKAAMQYVRRKKTDLQFDQGVVIIDIGASTMDIEYLKKKLNNPIEYSFELAGRNVDRLLAHYILKTAYGSAAGDQKPNEIPENAFFEERELDLTLFMFKVRVLKELISDRMRGSVKEDKFVTFPLNNNDSVQINGEILRGLLGEAKNNPNTGAVFGSRDIPIVYELPMLNYVWNKLPENEKKKHAVQVVNNTWYGHLEDMIRFVMDDLKKSGHSSVSKVIVTGGSCRLLGLKEHIWNAFDSAGIYIPMSDIQYMDTEQDYENSVPYGGGYYVSGVLSRMDELADFPDKLYKILFDELKTVAAAKTAEAVNSLVQELTLESLKWWTDQKEGSKNCSVTALNKEITQRCNSCFRNSNRLNYAVEHALKSITLDSLPKTKAEINVLLDALAQAKFTGNIKTTELKITLSAERVLKAVRNVNPYSLTMGLGPAFSGWMQEVGNFFYNIFDQGYENDNDIPRKKNYRQEAHDAYKKDKPSAITDTLRDNIAAALTEEFQKTDICGIPDQIIWDLRNDIMCALYLSD